MIKKIVVYLIIIAFSLSACNKQMKEDESISNNVIINNKFYNNSSLRKIFVAHNEQDINKIIKLLNDSLALNRYYALLALGSLNDTNHLYLKLNLLEDTSALVRQAAAFVIGLQKNLNASDILIKHYYNEKNPIVRAQIIEAIGKCGKANTIYFLSKLKIKSQEEKYGLAKALVHFAIRHKINDNISLKVLELLKDYNTDVRTKRVLSQYFYQPNVNITNFYKQLLHIYKNSEDNIVKINLLRALSRLKNKKNVEFLLEQLNNSNTQIQIEATRGLAKQNSTAIPSIMAKLTQHNNPFIAQIASEYFIKQGEKTEANYYFELAKTIKNWQARSLLLHAALKYAEDTLKEKFAKSIISGYKVTKNFYEQSYLLSSLAFYPQKYDFVRYQAFYTSQTIIKTTAALTLIKMRLQPNFDQIAENYYKEQGFDLNKEFSLITKELFKKGDYAQIYYASILLKNKKLNLFDNYENTFFINQGLSKLQLPRDLKVYKSVCQILKIYTGDTCKNPIYKMTSIDWKLIQNIANKTKVKIKTTKGDITIQLFPEKAPTTVATFIKMITQGYYNDTYIYKVIPGISVWSSSRRGDLWPDINIAHPIFLYPNNIEEGSIAMNLIDNNLESVQWFIILNPTPGMEDRYTIFGKIVQGLDIAKKLEVADKILSIELY